MKQVNRGRRSWRGVAAAGVAAAALLTVAACVGDPLRAEWRRSVGDPGQACFDFEQASPAGAVGPAVARGRSYSVVASDPGRVTIRYIVADGGGAAAPTEAICALRDGVFSAEDTLRRREHARAALRVETMMAEFDCLDRKKRWLRAGQPEQARRVQGPR